MNVLHRRRRAQACCRRDLVAVPDRFGVDAAGALVSGGFATSAHRCCGIVTGTRVSTSATGDVMDIIDGSRPAPPERAARLCFSTIRRGSWVDVASLPHGASVVRAAWARE